MKTKPIPTTMKTRLLGAALALALPLPAFAATVSETDPVPNVYDEETFEPLSGGIGYTWTVNMGETDSATLQGVVGAWSWDEDSFPETAKGWTHTSNWIALTLAKPARLTIRLERKSGIVDPYASIPGTEAGGNLYPAFTIYSNWDGDGGDNHTYNNRGNIDWAEDVTYLTHAENAATGITELTVDLPAGNFTIALGGNSPSELAEGRQGYLATLITKSLSVEPETPPSVEWEGKKRIVTTKSKQSLRGAIENFSPGTKVRLKINGKTRFAKIRGTNWTANLHLKPGRNIVVVTAIGPDGKASKSITLIVIRKK